MLVVLLCETLVGVIVVVSKSGGAGDVEELEAESEEDGEGDSAPEPEAGAGREVEVLGGLFVLAAFSIAICISLSLLSFSKRRWADSNSALLR